MFVEGTFLWCLAVAVMKGISFYKVQKDDETEGDQDVQTWHSAVC